MDSGDGLAQRFEVHRPRLRAVAYRMLGSVSEADDAVQEAWLHLSRTDISDVRNFGGWLTTTVARISLDMLRSRRSCREEPLDEHLPEPIVSPDGGGDPEHEALLADSVGLALLVVLDTLDPAERVAFVLHDMFAVPFDVVAAVLGRSPAAAAARQPRPAPVRQADPFPDPDPARQREVVDAFLAAARDGDFDALVAVLDPDVVLRADGGPAAARVVHGARTVAEGALSFAGRVPFARPALVNATAGLVVVARGRPIAVLAFTVKQGKITVIDILTDPARLDRLLAR